MLVKFKRKFLCCFAVVALLSCSENSGVDEKCKDCRADQTCTAEGICVDKPVECSCPKNQMCDTEGECIVIDSRLCVRDEDCEGDEECNAEGECVDRPAEKKCPVDITCAKGQVCNAEGVCIDRGDECDEERACPRGRRCKADEGGGKNTCVKINENGCRNPGDVFACTAGANTVCVAFYHTLTTTCEAPPPEGIGACPAGCLANQVCYVNQSHGDTSGTCAGTDTANPWRFCFDATGQPLLGCADPTSSVCISVEEPWTRYYCGQTTPACNNECPEGQVCYSADGSVAHCTDLSGIPQGGCWEETDSFCVGNEVCEAQSNSCFTPIN